MKLQSKYVKELNSLILLNSCVNRNFFIPGQVSSRDKISSWVHVNALLNMLKHSPRSFLNGSYSWKFCRSHWKTTVCSSLFYNEDADCMFRVKLLRSHFTWHRCFPVKLAKFLRTPTILQNIFFIRIFYTFTLK